MHLKGSFSLSRVTNLTAAIAFLALPALSQERPRWEIGAFGGGYFGSRISLTPTADTRIENGPTFGLRGAFALNQRFRLETSLSRASVRVASFDPATGSALAPSRPGRVATYELDLLYGFGSRRVRGYFGLGAGAMTLPSLGTRFAGNVAVGGEFFLDERLGLRIDGRYRWRASDRRVGTVVCESAGCFPFTTSLISSAEATGGVTYRFGADAGGSTHSGSGDDTEEPRRFWLAALEVAGLGLVPYAVNRWVSDYDFAQVTPAAIQANFLTGYTYDRDRFSTNEFEHALHGNHYFNAARSNGYGFWESGIFTFMGSFVWECCTEIEPPAINDQVNATLGGMQVGEVAHRLSRLLLDNTATGSGRVWREIGGLFLNPVGEFNRFLRGDMTRVGSNPEDRLPSRFRLDCDLGYRHIEGSASFPDQGTLTVSALYGDPFEGQMQKPFDSFSVGVDVAWPASAHLARVEQQGILKGWDLSDPSSRSRHILGVFMGYHYVNNEVETFAAQSVGAGLFSRYPVGAGLQCETGVTASIFPLAAIKTSEAIDALSGRNYDYAPGGGLRIDTTLHRAGRDLATVAYGVGWARTVDGPSSSNTLQFLRVSAVVPLGKRFGAGVLYQWYSRDTSYAGAASQHQSQSEWRVFLRRSL
ncbi:MAG: DUF3943 domain-containing protein [Thermoanaerobaculia bacterium]